MPKRVLFVCTGNTCRSPMAVGFLRAMAPDKNLTITSAGTSAAQGIPASPHAVTAMQEENIDITDHRSRILDGYLLEEANIVFVMAEHHRRHIINWFRNLENKVHLLREFDPVRDDPDYPNVPDPMGFGVDVYRRSREMIHRSLDSVLKIL